MTFEMLAGRPPFEGDDPMSLTYQHVHAEPPRIASLVPGVPSELASIVHQLLEKDPNDRPRTAEEVRAALAVVPDVAPPVVPNGPAAMAATEPLLRTPTAVLPPRRSATYRRSNVLSSWVPWAAVMIVAVAVLLVLNAVIGRGPATGRAAQGQGSAAQGSPATSVSPSASPSVSSTPIPPADPPSEAAAALVGLVQQMESAGALEGHLSKDLAHEVDAVLRELDHGDADKAFEHIAHINEVLASGVEHGDVSAEDAQTLQDAIDQLASTIGGSGNGEGNGDGGEGD